MLVLRGAVSKSLPETIGYVGSLNSYTIVYIIPYYDIQYSNYTSIYPRNIGIFMWSLVMLRDYCGHVKAIRPPGGHWGLWGCMIEGGWQDARDGAGPGLTCAST